MQQQAGTSSKPLIILAVVSALAVIVASLIFIFSNFSAQPEANTTSSSNIVIIPALCESSDDPAMCTSISETISPGVALTPHTLAVASIKAAASRAVRGRANAARLAYSVRDQTVRQRIAACRGAYSDVLHSLQAAADVLRTSGDKEELRRSLSAALESVGMCEKGFDEVEGKGFPLKRVNSNLVKMVRTSMTMGDQL